MCLKKFKTSREVWKGGFLILHSRSFFTRIPHPAQFFLSLSRIPLFFSRKILAQGCRAKKLNWPIRIQRAGKTLLSWNRCKWTRKALKSGNSSHWKRLHIFRKRHLQFQKPYQSVKIENYNTVWAWLWRQRQATRSQFVECRQVG